MRAKLAYSGSSAFRREIWAVEAVAVRLYIALVSPRTCVGSHGMQSVPYIFSHFLLAIVRVATISVAVRDEINYELTQLVQIVTSVKTPAMYSCGRIMPY